ncbi:hypothetical protein ACFOON_15240 [Novosphingobium piscinae]|uniref:Uncharacterized protein n=1 Tax=Novosphingobium piscinae TaxID=1507448 RepID=A0A7X1FXJ5_9SPHN|nr:hypothetical protein [Novosphingobium piscinae]MBC2668746.1 hypothetical protein [Novosphingobium piscinae]
MTWQPPATKDVDAIKAHAERLLERMRQTPHGPKRSLLAEQHIAKTDEAKFAEGWNAAVAAMNLPETPANTTKD